MPSVRKIICLANSWKKHERCIAGIDVDTGKWVRPVCDTLYPETGKVPKWVRFVEGREPKLLDILAIPLDDTGNDFGFECENYSVLAGQWQYLGRANIEDVLPYCDRGESILHNRWKYVYPSYLRSLPFHQRTTLQLIFAERFSIEGKANSKGYMDWRGTIVTSGGICLRKIKITDPLLVKKLDGGYDPPTRCLVTMSLSIPYAFPDWEGEAPAWKLIAGVIAM